MGDHAVVLGAGVAGLLAAAVLAEHSSSVTVVERDRLPDKPISRRGASQGRHLHSFLSRGTLALEEILPGCLDEIAEAGAVFLDDHDVGEFIGGQPNRITGVRVTDRTTGTAATLAALHALTLRDHLVETKIIAPQQFYRDTTVRVAPVWAMNQPPDRGTRLRGKRALVHRVGTWSRRKILEAAQHDVVVTERLMRVTNLIDPPQRLLEPRLLARVLTHHARRSVSNGPRLH